MFAVAGIALASCSGRGAQSALPVTKGAAAVEIPTARSVSPASIPVAPMARTAIRPSSEMASLHPQSAVTLAGWTQIPGGASAIAATPDGSIWVISSAGSGPDRAIWHYANGGWTNIPGAAMRIAAAPDNSVWVINSAGGIYHYVNGGFAGIAGGASDITVANDGSVYVISSQGGGPYGRGIWHYANGAWTQMPGAGVRIHASWDTGSYTNVTPGGFWVTNAGQSIFYYNPSTGFAQIPGAAVALAPTTIGGLYVLGVPNSPNGNPIYYFDLSSGAWTQQPGAAVDAATDGSTSVYVLGAAGGIYRSTITIDTSGPVGVAPTVGYLAQRPSGSFAGELTAVRSGATVVAISTSEVTGGSGLLATDSLAFQLGSTALGASRVAQSVHPKPPAGPRAALERPVESSSAAAALRARLPRAHPGARIASSARRAESLGTTVGSTAQFWVSVFPIGASSGTDVQVPATLEAVSTYGYVWVDDTLLATTPFLPGSLQSTVGAIAADLDNAYLSDTTHFGTTYFTASAPGVTKYGAGYEACDATGKQTGVVPALVAPPDGKINAFIINESALGAGVGGYFADNNYIPQSAFNCLIGQSYGGGPVLTAATIPHSNEAPMIYVGWEGTNPAWFETGEDLVRGTAHEMQHLINFVNHVALHAGNDEDRWLNEGMSMLAQDLALNRMYGIPHDADDALYHANQATAAPQNVSLTAFTGIDPGSSSLAFNCSACYGEEFLFQRYLYDRFGGDAYLHAMLSGPVTSYANLQQATGIAPQTVISDFAIALGASGTGTTSDPRFGLSSLNLLAAYADQTGRQVTVGTPATTALPSSAAPYVGTFAYYALGAAALNQDLSAKDVGGKFGLQVGVVQR